MKIKNTHAVELLLTPQDLAKALGHPGALVREAEVQIREGKVDGLRVRLEYLIATRGMGHIVRTTASVDTEP